MENKQIIIDDIDVSKCEYYKEYSNPNEDGDEYNDICECSITESAFCFDKYNSNCYYKQLKRKEQECDRLKHDNEYEVGALEKTIDNLKAENDSLFKAIEEIENIIGKYKLSETVIKLNRINPIDVQEILNIVIKARNNKCEELKKYLHQNFKEKDNLHLIIDRLLEASGYDTNTASAEDFEDVYENMRYEKQQLDRYKQTLTEIKEIAEPFCNACQEFEPEKSKNCINCTYCNYNKILQKISEVI